MKKAALLALVCAVAAVSAPSDYAPDGLPNWITEPPSTWCATGKYIDMWPNRINVFNQEYLCDGYLSYHGDDYDTFEQDVGGGGCDGCSEDGENATSCERTLGGSQYLDNCFCDLYANPSSPEVWIHKPNEIDKCWQLYPRYDDFEERSCPLGTSQGMCFYSKTFHGIDRSGYPAFTFTDEQAASPPFMGWFPCSFDCRSQNEDVYMKQCICACDNPPCALVVSRHFGCGDDF